MPRGGARPGAGRKPKDKSNVVGFPTGASMSAGGGSSLTPLDAASADLLTPPVDLSPQQQSVWRRYAPLALEQRTLTPMTVPGFRELCRLVAFADVQAERVEKFGSDAAMKHFQKLVARVDPALARFKLTAFGKPADGSAKPKAETNPWAQTS